MGPTNIALVQLFQADQQLREAQGRLEAATRRVRLQERRVKSLEEELAVARSLYREHQSHADTLELEIKSRDAQIEKLRTQQQNAKSNREYQTFLLEINTLKVDRNKVEDETMKVLQDAEEQQNLSKTLSGQLEQETDRLNQMKAEIDATVASLQREVEELRPVRERAALAVPARLLEIFDRLCEKYDGEAMASIGKPDRRREEYVCNACNMSLVTDAYNRLHVRDDPVFCPSCGRMLYIPDELPPEMAINARKSRSTSENAVS